MIKKLFFLITISLMTLTPSLSHAQMGQTHIDLPTSYSSYFGVYDHLRLVPRAALSNPCDPGTIYVEAPDHVRFCYDTGQWGPFPAVWTQTGDLIYPSETNTNPNIAVGLATTAPAFALHLAATGGGGGILAYDDTTGGTNTVLQPTGAGSQLLWYPRKSAFFAGYPLTGLDDATVFLNSVSLGEQNSVQNDSVGLGSHVSASQSYSVALGQGTVAADSSVAIGDQSQADQFCVALGSQTWARRPGGPAILGSVAMGGNSIPGNITQTFLGGSLALGDNAVAQSDSSTSIGSQTIASGTGSVAIGGPQTQATNSYSTAVGLGSTAQGLYSTAMGLAARAVGTASVAMGSWTMPGLGATGDYSTAFGLNTWASAPSSTAMGNGSSATNNNSIAIGGTTTASGTSSIAFGDRTVAQGINSAAMGTQSRAVGTGSIAMGSLSVANGDYSIAMGDQATTSVAGVNGVSIGSITRANGTSAVAFGRNTTASGAQSVAFGENNTASGQHAIVFGYNNLAQSPSSVVMGNTNQAVGPAGGFVTGEGNFSRGTYSTALGANITANGISSVAIGLAEGANVNVGNAILSIMRGRVLIGRTASTPPGYTLEVNGTAYKSLGAGSWGVTSDRRLKNNIHPLGPETLDRLLQLQGKFFEWKNPEENSDQKGVQMGFIAQDVEKVFPQWVIGGDKGSYKYLNVNGIEALTVEAVRELNNDIDASKEDLQKFKKQLADLK